MRASSDAAAWQGTHWTGEPGLGTEMTARPSTTVLQPATNTDAAARTPTLTTPILRFMAPHAAMNLHRPWRGSYLVASSSSSSASEKSSARSQRSGSSSGHDTMPTSSLPLSDITVMFSPEP